VRRAVSGERPIGVGAASRERATRSERSAVGIHSLRGEPVLLYGESHAR
jgi:hypothetical protein